MSADTGKGGNAIASPALRVESARVSRYRPRTDAIQPNSLLLMSQKTLTVTAEHRAQDAAAFVRRYRWLILAGLITAAVPTPASSPVKHSRRRG